MELKDWAIILGIFFLGYTISSVLHSCPTCLQTNSTINLTNSSQLILDTPNNFTIASWNLQIFGVSKASDEALVKKYTDIMKRYDIIFVQEIRDSTNGAFKTLCNGMEGYLCKISSRAGRSTSKEQYAVFYKPEVSLIQIVDYNNEELDRWERPPVQFRFNVSNDIFSVFVIHVKPDNATEEIKYLKDLTYNLPGKVIILGDLNADCSYYAESSKDFADWNWVITDAEDTTVAKTNCTYDRIIVNPEMALQVLNYSVMKEVTPEMSDHYLVSAQIGVSGL